MIGTLLYFAEVLMLLPFSYLRKRKQTPCPNAEIPQSSWTASESMSTWVLSRTSPLPMWPSLMAPLSPGAINAIMERVGLLNEGVRIFTVLTPMPTSTWLTLGSTLFLACKLEWINAIFVHIFFCKQNNCGHAHSKWRSILPRDWWWKRGERNWTLMRLLI